ncbi:MAG TPA: hypothetical protein VGL19_11480 [Polyangiaceae bacterium]
MGIKTTRRPRARARQSIGRISWWLPALLYFAGAAHWIIFFRNGQLTFEACDWPKEALYLRALGQALHTLELPWFLRVPEALSAFPQLSLAKDASGTAYVPLLALPELNLSPQIVLLRWVGPGVFELVNVLLLYSVGFAGAMALRTRHGLSALPFCALFLLFNFNGHIVSHLAVGHAMWSGYFLLPYFVHYALEWAAQPTAPDPPIRLALVLSALAYQGSVHLLMSAALVIACAMGCSRALWSGGASALGLGLGLSGLRLLPALLVLRLMPSSGFLGGYATLSDDAASLLNIRGPEFPAAPGKFGSLGWWEYDAYIGEVGLLFLAYFGVWRGWQRRRSGDSPYAALLLPLALVALLSFSVVAYPLYAVRMPLLASERVTSRYLVIPLLVLITVSCIQLETTLQKWRMTHTRRVIIGAALMIEALSLVAHSERWSLGRLENVESLAWHDVSSTVELVQPHPHWLPLYTASLAIGALVTASSVLLCVLLKLRGAPLPGAIHLCPEQVRRGNH